MERTNEQVTLPKRQGRISGNFYLVNFAVLLRSLGMMVLLLGAAMVLSIVLASIIPTGKGHDTGLHLSGWWLSIGIAVGLGAALWGGGKYLGNRSKRPGTMRRREAMALVGAGWVVCSLIGALPYLLCEPHATLPDALFESVSGLTTTGATVFSDLASLPKSILMWRSVTQWVGGMGILAIFVVVLSGMTSSSKTLIGAESSLANSDISSLRQTMRQIWALYLVFTFVCGIGLYLFGLTPFQSVNYALTAVATGGFGTESDSVGAIFTVGSKMWLIIFMVLGAISFPFYLILMRRRFSDLGKRFEEVWWFLGMLGFFIISMLIVKATGGTEVAAIDLVFNLVSIGTSTGYVSDDYDQWNRLGIGIILLFMMIGGCSGSTSGGLKMSRVLLFFRYVSSGLSRSFRPQAVSPVKLNGRQVADETASQLFLVLTLFGFFGIAGTMLFQLFDPQLSLTGAVSGVMSCLGNIGPAFAEMGPTESVGGISTPSKFLFVCLMILGRLEYVALLVLFLPSLWKRY